MTKKELEIRLAIAEKSINNALQSLSKENIQMNIDEENHKDYSMNLACGYAKSVGSADSVKFIV